MKSDKILLLTKKRKWIITFFSLLSLMTFHLVSGAMEEVSELFISNFLSDYDIQIKEIKDNSSNKTTKINKKISADKDARVQWKGTLTSQATMRFIIKATENQSELEMEVPLAPGDHGISSNIKPLVVYISAPFIYENSSVGKIVIRYRDDISPRKS